MSKITANYSKKVMELFMHPKNVGEIKDADGIGKVGNPVCLLPQEKIHKNSEMKGISNLEKEQSILTHTGYYEKIMATSKRDYNGQVLIIKNKLGQVSLTPEHLIYAIGMPGGDKFLRNKGKRSLIPSWHHANQLKKGDIVLYPLLKKEEDEEFLQIDIEKPKYDFRSKKIPKKIPLNSGLLRLFGYFLSEGNIQDKPCKTFISFTLNIKEKDIAEDIKNISKQVFNLDVKIKEKPEAKTLIVFLYNAQIARFFKKLFDNGAGNKRLPDFVMNLPLEKQKHLLTGLWKGDGYVNLNRNGPRAGFVTISYQLAQQIKTLLLRQRIVPSIYLDKEKKVKGVNHKKSYRFHVGQRESLIRLCKILGIEYNPRSYASVDSWFDDNYLYTPITEKESLDYNGIVYNLEVNNSHSFVSEAFTLHNCGDVMWIYIKVSKNKKGQEILKDIKFKTFGCAAAIATSSMITELAKGKTIGEAMRITRGDVADSLEGLPPIKMHCSNLAADGLHAAVLDYYKKQGNKEMLKKYSSLKPHDEEHEH